MIISSIFIWTKNIFDESYSFIFPSIYLFIHLFIYLTCNHYVYWSWLINRFGEESLHSCEVMLKDVEDSKRINNTIRSEWNTNEQQQSQTVDENKVSYTINHAYHIYVSIPPYTYHLLYFHSHHIHMYQLKYLV